MNYYVLSLFIATAVCIFLCVKTFRNRKIRGSITMFWTMAAVAWISFSYILEIVSTTFAQKLFWYKMEYSAIPFIPLLWLIFSLQYADMDKRTVKKKVMPLLALPVLVSLLVWTNDYHHLFIRDLTISSGSPVEVIVKTNWIGYWANVVFSYTFLLIGTILLMRSVFAMYSKYFKQGFIFILGVMIPLFLNVLYLFGINPLAPFDLTPIAFTLSGAILVWGLFRLRFFSLVPFAREKVFDYMDAGVLIIDSNETVVDLNQSIKKIFRTDALPCIGRNVFDLFQTCGISIKRDLLDGKTKKEICLENGERKYYLISTSRIEKEKDELSGHIIVFSDITKSKKASMAISAYNKKIIKLNHAARELGICKTSDEVFRKTAEYAFKILDLKHCSFFLVDHPYLLNKYNSSPRMKRYARNQDFTQKLRTFSGQNNAQISIHTYCFEGESCSILKMILSRPILAVFYHVDKKAFTKENIGLCQLLLGHSLESLKSIEFLKKLHDQAEKDSLTGAYNRRYFNTLIKKEMSRAKRYDYPIALVMADINRFKEINDRFGHQAGDDVLKETAKQIKERIRKEDTLIRYGGDEFLIVLPQAEGNSIREVTKRICQAVDGCKSPNACIDFSIGLSIGVAIWKPSEKKEIEEILNIADMQMYKNKKLSRQKVLLSS
jgi:diguanylate cyclase (GGDEF)-like protein/PAS domain S-box-containing protein